MPAFPFSPHGHFYTSPAPAIQSRPCARERGIGCWRCPCTPTLERGWHPVCGCFDREGALHSAWPGGTVNFEKKMLKIKFYLFFFNSKLRRLSEPFQNSKTALLRSFNLKAPRGVKRQPAWVLPHSRDLWSPASRPPSPPNYLGRAFGTTSWRDMVTLARSQRTLILHSISDFICFGILFLLLFKCKKKKQKNKTKKILTLLLHALKYVSTCPKHSD